MTDSTGTTARTYDELGRVLTKSVPGLGTSTYIYDIIDSSKGIEEGQYGEESKDPKGNVTLKIFDKAGRLKKVKADNEGAFTIYEYDGNGNRISVTYPEGSKEEYTYYNDNLLKTLTNKKASGEVIDTYEYWYDAAHNQTSKKDKKGVTSYFYDSLNGLEVTAELSGKTVEYTFDEAGNRLTEKVTANGKSDISTYEYNEENRLLNITKESSAQKIVTKFLYDNNGNMLQKCDEVSKKVDASKLSKPHFGLIILGQSNTKHAEQITKSVIYYTYDALNQMIKSSAGAQTVQYVYNADGLRVEKTTNGKTTKYLYECDKVVLETDQRGTQTASNVYGTNLISRTMGIDKAFYFYNGHGDVTSLTDQVGNILGTYYYDSFGNITDLTGSTNNPYKYSGYEHDSETGNYYLKSRYYAPDIARFLSEDTYTGTTDDPLSLNLYSYCCNEPVMYEDIDGHRPMPITGDPTTDAKVKASMVLAKVSSKGSDVRDIQLMLNKAGYNLKADGAFGSKTETAIKDFQKKAGLKADGIVGAKTWSALENQKPKVTRIQNQTPVVKAVTKPVAKVMSKPTLVSKTIQYIKDSGEQVVKGKYTDKVTAAGTGGEIALGFFGLDAPGDIRDISYDVKNWKWTWGHAAETGIDVMGVLPVIGLVKYSDEVSQLTKVEKKITKGAVEAAEFEKKISKMSPNDRVAAVKTEVNRIANESELIKDNKLTKINKRDVYRNSNTGELFAVDTQHGRFESLNSKNGKHLGEVDFDFNPIPNSLDKSGGHDLKIK